MEDAQYFGLVTVCGDDSSKYMVKHSSPVREKIMKFGDVTEDYAARVFLMPRHVPPNTDARMRNKFRVHDELEDVDYYPYVLYKIRGDKKKMLHPDGMGYFQLDFPDDKGVDEDGAEPKYYFKVSNVVFDHRETLRIDEDFVLRFLKSHEDGISLLQQIRMAFLYYADIEEWAATMISLWTMATFVYQSFTAFPYLYMLAERNSGKTRVLKTLSHLTNTGVFLASPRLPTVFRLGDALNPTFVFDEMEFLTKTGAREDENQEFLNVLNVGYERGAKVYRTNSEKGMRQDAFDAYCPKALATTEEISGILNSRCLRNPIKRTNNLEYVNRDPIEDIPFLRSLQEDVLFWSIGNAAELCAYDRDTVFRKYQKQFAGSPPRILQIMMPLLVVFEYLKESSELTRERQANVDAFEGHLKEIIAYQATESKSVSTDDSTVRILLALNKCVQMYKKASPWPGVMNKEVRERIEEELDREEDIKFYSPKKIGKVLSRFSIPKREMDGKPQYFGGPNWSYEKAGAFVQDLLSRYNIETAEAIEAKDELEREAQTKRQSLEVE